MPPPHHDDSGLQEGRAQGGAFQKKKKKTHHDDEPASGPCRFVGHTGFSPALLLSHHTNDESLSSSSYASSSSRITVLPLTRCWRIQRRRDKVSTLPCVVFPSHHGYMVFSLAKDRMRDDVRLHPVTGRRVLPSPYVGEVLFHGPCRLSGTRPVSSTRSPASPRRSWTCPSNSGTRSHRRCASPRHRACRGARTPTTASHGTGSCT